MVFDKVETTSKLESIPKNFHNGKIIMSPEPEEEEDYTTIAYDIDDTDNALQEDADNLRVDDDNDDDDDDDDDDSVDPLAMIKAPESSEKKSGGLIRRNESWDNFQIRSQRSIRLGPDKPPSPEERKRRTVQFHDDDKLALVHEFEKVPSEEKDRVWLDDSDFRRMEDEIRMTQFRWQNHVDGKIKFDEANNTLRGLEGNDRSRAGLTWKHAKAVLEAINQQKAASGDGASNDNLDWEKIRRVSIKSSRPEHDRVQDMARQDEGERRRIWEGEDEGSGGSSGNGYHHQAFQSSSNHQKKKKKGGWIKNLFGKK